MRYLEQLSQNLVLLLILEMLYNQYDFAFNLSLKLSLPINTSKVNARENTIDAI